MAHPHPSTLTDEPDLASYLRQLNAAITARASELRDQAATDQPAWTAGLGARPGHPEAAAEWDELAGLAAAFRETYNITDDRAGTPLGPEPETAGAKAHA
jgi:hypothetical protein